MKNSTFAFALLSTFVAPFVQADHPAAEWLPNKQEKADQSQLTSLVEEGKKEGMKVIDIITQPTKESSYSITYKFPEKLVRPGESVYFRLPARLQKRGVNFVILGHRQDPQKEKGMEPGNKWDKTPAYSSVQVHTSQPEFAASPWRYWQGDASSKNGAKFAESRYDVEMEGLYEWPKHGHGGVDKGDSSHAPLLGDAVRVVVTGDDPVLMSELTVKVSPPRSETYVTGTFSDGTNIGDPETGDGRYYTGGQQYGGKFPGAMTLGYSGKTVDSKKLPEGWVHSGNRLEIPLPPGVNFESLEVAGGDSRPDGVTNKDGGKGSSGWAKLYASLVKANGVTDSFLQRENVPPEGVIVASPGDASYVTQPGDRVVIESKEDTMYVMAVRVGYSQAK